MSTDWQAKRISNYFSNRLWGSMALAVSFPVMTLQSLATPTQNVSSSATSSTDPLTTIQQPTAQAIANPNAKAITQPLKTDTLPDSIAAKITEANLPTDSVSIMVQPLYPNDTKAQTPVISYHADTPRTPASTQKLIPTFIALDSLGKDFTWQTKLYQNGMVWQGTLYGDVIIQGSGDPKLDSDKIYQLLNMIKSQGIEHVTGDLIIDNRQFEGVNFDVNAFDGKGQRPYNAQPNALLVNFGTLKVDVTPIIKDTAATSSSNKLASAVIDEADLPISGETPDVVKPAPKPNDITGFKVAVKPTLKNFTAPNELPAGKQPCKTGSDDWIATLSATELAFDETPSIYCGAQERWLTFPDGDVMVKNMIVSDWQQILPKFSGNVRFAERGQDVLAATKPIPDALPWYLRWYLKWQKTPIQPKLIAYIPSAPLSEQISDINHFSNNVMTEQVTLSLPLYADKKSVSNYPAAFDYIKRWWQKNVPNTPPPVMTRGSGLCRDCQVAPKSLLALLNFAYHHKDFATYQHSLSIAGESGTMKHLKDRQPDNPAIGRAWIKTGTLDNVTSMAGYIQGQSGQWYAVVGMINQDNVVHNYKAKAVLDEMLAWTASH